MSLHHVIPSNLKGSQGSSGSGVLDGVVILVCGKGEAVSRCKALQRQTKTNIFFFFFPYRYENSCKDTTTVPTVYHIIDLLIETSLSGSQQSNSSANK
jgi:hypothetical protein